MNEPSPPLESKLGDELLADLADEFLLHYRAGEQPSVDELAGKYPDLADRIRELFPAMIAMEQPALGATVDLAPSVERVGATIGRYKLLERIGEGGFGVVYMAEQQHPVRRKVALKVVKPGMDSCQVLARFEAERQALAIMDHPNIAKVFDAGATDAGRPYFVMELVRGEPITEFCDRNQLSPRARLELFAQVCRAVQHAHTKGVIHRDIKPTNVLVEMHDTSPVVKVIDFGVAKALGQELTDKTLFTGFAQLLGTPLYMSPEQAGRSALDIDTRSDIYSLGVLLYELLTGTTPFDRERFKRAAHDEICRIIREEEPPKPSTRLSESKASLLSISAQRQTEPATLTRLVRGELDWIVMKALEKDRARRYETASGMAHDIERYLRSEPVEACPPSSLYRFKKFVRRNKGPVLAAALVLIALIAGIAGTSFGLMRAEQARRAEAKRAAGERQARQESQEREAETNAVLDFVENKVLAAARPEGLYGGLGHDVTLRRAIEVALPFVDESFKDRPLIEARLRMTLGWSFEILSEHKIGGEQFSKALALYAKHRGPNHLDTIESKYALATSYDHAGRHDEALKLFKDALAHFKAKLGPEHSDTLKCMHGLAISYLRHGRHAESIKLLEETLKLRKAKPGSNRRATLISMMDLASAYGRADRQRDAIKLYEATLALMNAELGSEHPSTLLCKNNLAVWYTRLNRPADAFKILPEALTSARTALGPHHRQTFVFMRNLATCYDGLGQHDEAIELYEETLALMKAHLGPDDPETLACRGCLGVSYANVGRHAEAARLREESLSLRKVKFGDDHPNTLGTMKNLAITYMALGRHRDAINLRKELLAIQKVKLGPDHADTLSTMNSVLQSAEALGEAEFDRAVEEYREAFRLEPNSTFALNQLVGALNHRSWTLATDANRDKRDPDRAVELAAEVVTLTPQVADCWNNLGVARYRAADYEGAIAALEKFRQLRTGTGEWSNPFFLAMAHWQLGNKDEAQRWYKTAVTWMDKKAPKSESLIRFRAEASDLMGLNDKTVNTSSSASRQ